jgi:hypothetical protein
MSDIGTTGFDETGEYLILPSNTRSIDGHTPNKMWDYKIPLQKPFMVDNKHHYEVGMKSISFPHSWRRSVRLKSCQYKKVSMANLSNPSAPPLVFSSCVSDTEGTEVNTLKDLIAALNERRPKLWMGGFFLTTCRKFSYGFHMARRSAWTMNLCTC